MEKRKILIVVVIVMLSMMSCKGIMLPEGVFNLDMSYMASHGSSDGSQTVASVVVSQEADVNGIIQGNWSFTLKRNGQILIVVNNSNYKSIDELKFYIMSDIRAYMHPGSITITLVHSGYPKDKYICDRIDISVTVKDDNGYTHHLVKTLYGAQ